MERKIFRLPEAVINKIAAGEVVENPASVVKELIENSIDAGSTKISVEITQGGQQRICIEDNGCGMSPEDAEGCLERHATSKIHEVEDLDRLCTMGFRGEALAAIGAVSHLEIKTSDGKQATRIVSEGGRVLEIAPCARNRGTTMDVRSLFFNVPARKKFQKSAGYNATQVRKVVETIALAHPDISFALKVNGREAFDLPVAPLKKRIAQVLGEYEHEVFAEGISGYVAAPAKASTTRTGQYLFMNKRPIFSPLIARAVKEGFGTRIAESLHPAFVIYLEIPPDCVDVNVHPQKKEVRFQDESALFRKTQKAIEASFGSLSSFETPVSFSSPPTFSEALAFPAFRSVEPREFVQELEVHFASRPLAVFGNLLLLEKGNLVIADLNAMHARVLFEQIRYEKMTAQTLIWPLEIPVEDEEVAEELSLLGIECRLLKKTLVIDALPPCLDAAKFPLFFAKWQETKQIEIASVRFAKAHQKTYMLQEAELLWRQLQKCKDIHYDPMGNPIWVELKEEELSSFLQKARLQKAGI